MHTNRILSSGNSKVRGLWFPRGTVPCREAIWRWVYCTKSVRWNYGTNIGGEGDVAIKRPPPERRSIIGVAVRRHSLSHPEVPFALLCCHRCLARRQVGDIDERIWEGHERIVSSSANVKCEHLLAIKYRQRIKLQCTREFWFVSDCARI